MLNRPRRCTSLLAHVLVAVFAILLFAPAARGQSGSVSSAESGADPERYSFIARAEPLTDALKRLVIETQIDLYYDSRLVSGRRANCAIERASSEAILKCLLAGTGLDYVRLSSGTYVLVEGTETAPRFGGLTGIVLDAQTKQPLPNAHVMVAEASSGTTANEAGRFTFARLKPGTYVVVASYLGYESLRTTVRVPPGSTTTAELALTSEPLLVEPVIVDGLSSRIPNSGLGLELSHPEERDRMPAAGGNVVAGLGTMLGVRVNDATADLHIQGGESGEHMLRLDGVPVFLPLSFASFIGPFSPFAIGQITVHKAGFGALVGSQISGVIDIHQNLSEAAERRLDVQVDPLSANMRAHLRHGTTDGVQTTVMAAGRLGMWDLYAPGSLRSLLGQWNRPDPFLKVAFDRATDGTAQFGEALPYDESPGVGYGDLHLASRVRFGLLQSLHTSLYWGRNRLGTDANLIRNQSETPAVDLQDGRTVQRFRDHLAWNTGVAQSTYERVIGSRTLVSMKVRGSYYRLGHSYNVPDSLVQNPDDGNRIYEVALETLVDYSLGRYQQLTLGTDLVRTDSRFAFLGTQSLPVNHHAANTRATLLLNDEIRLGPYFTVRAGSRFSYLATHNAFFAEPRLSLQFDRDHGPLGPWSTRLSSGVYRQFINQFDVSTRSPGALLSSNRFWLVADSTLRPPLASHYAAELLFQPRPKWSLQLEAYYKSQPHILAIDYASSVTAAGGAHLAQRDFIRTSRGFVSGAGVNVQRRLGPGRAAVRYEYSVAKRRIPEFFQGRLQRTPWDEPHRVELLLDAAPVARLSLISRLHAVWGRRWGFRQGYYDFLGAYESLPDADLSFSSNVERQIDYYHLRDPNHDEHRLPALYQLDLSLGYTYPLGPASLQLRGDVLNVLNTANVAEWYLRFDPDVYYGIDPGSEVPSGYLLKTTRPVLPRVLSLAVKVTWE